MKTLLSALCLLMIFGSQAMAGPEAWLQPGVLTPERLTELKKELNLSPDQQEKMQDIISAAREEGSPLENELRNEQRRFSGLLRQRETTPEAASLALADLLKAEAAVKQLQLRALLQLRDLLSLDQQKKALKLTPEAAGRTEDLSLRVKQKAEKLRAAVESLGIKPTRAMSERGAQIERLIQEGQWAAAEAALDQLSRESGADEAESSEEIDFAPFEPGSTDLEELRLRYARVEEKAQQVISLPLVRQFLKAKAAFEAAKEAQDAEKVGRILTWAEKQLENF